MTSNKLANFLDSLRIFPRVILLCYIIAVGVALDWYFDFEVKYVVNCNAEVMQVVLKEAPGKIEVARSIACTEVDVIARPVGYTALMSVLVGAGAGIFGLYMNTGKQQ